MNWLEDFFGLKRAGTSVRTEVVAGATTFLAMVYITAVNPGILSETGMDFGAVFVATCLAAAAGSIVMGVMGNFPIAQAPGMGQNAFFTYGIVLGMGFTWQEALGAVFISGVIFIVLSVLPVREWLINAIPHNLKMGISAGIGLFLGFIALRNAGIIVANPVTFVGLGDVTVFGAAACLFGFVLISVLSKRNIPGAVVIGMLATSILGWTFTDAEIAGVVAMPPSLDPVLMELDIWGALELSMISVIITILIVDVFDTAGTLVAVSTRANLLDEKGHLPRLNKALLSDSGASTVGAVLGTSSTTSFIESAAGVEAGGRTGLTAVVCGVLFLLCLFFAPLAQSIPAYAAASALLFVACIMARSLADLSWDQLDESAPAMIAALAMPLTFSVTAGIGLGFITYMLMKVVDGRYRECPLAVYAGAAVFAGKFIFLS
ncbi:MAG: guanine permease [Cellvibrionaceae bacterium]|nr:guanine permease [Cellvibrionaceae bacterium]|tara:strand:+ start:20954 stop:22252 length:1299 start_codon:yes stop_codon:yes gene_type:complete